VEAVTEYNPGNRATAKEPSHEGCNRPWQPPKETNMDSAEVVRNHYTRGGGTGGHRVLILQSAGTSILFVSGAG